MTGRAALRKLPIVMLAALSGVGFADRAMALVMIENPVATADISICSNGGPCAPDNNLTFGPKFDVTSNPDGSKSATLDFSTFTVPLPQPVFPDFRATARVMGQGSATEGTLKASVTARAAVASPPGTPLGANPFEADAGGRLDLEFTDSFRVEDTTGTHGLGDEIPLTVTVKVDGGFAKTSNTHSGAAVFAASLLTGSFGSDVGVRFFECAGIPPPPIVRRCFIESEGFPASHSRDLTARVGEIVSIRGGLAVEALALESERFRPFLGVEEATADFIRTARYFVDSPVPGISIIGLETGHDYSTAAASLVPEPSSLALLAVGLAGVGSIAWRKHRGK